MLASWTALTGKNMKYEVKYPVRNPVRLACES